MKGSRLKGGCRARAALHWLGLGALALVAAPAFAQASTAPAAAGVALKLVAGSPGGSGTANGPCTSARFTYPLGIVVNSSNTVYVADYYSDTIREITPDCVVSTLAGTPGVTGSQDGTGASASFDGPTGLTMDAAGNLYVTDTHNNLIRKITTAGVVTTVAGTPGVSGSADGVGSAASFNFPQGIAADANGNLYVADTYNDTVRRIASNGTVSTLAGSAGVVGAVDGSGAAARFNEPTGIAVTPAGEILLSDSHNYTVRLIGSDGTVSTFAGAAGVPGSADGTGAQAQFGYPTGMVVDAGGTAYVIDSGNDTLRTISPGATVSTLAGTPGVKGSTNGTGPVASFNYPTGVAVASNGLVYVADSRNYAVRTVTPAGVVQTLAGDSTSGGSADGAGAVARFDSPAGVAFDRYGNEYVADNGNNTIRKIDRRHVVSTLAGSAGTTGSADGQGPAARFNSPMGVAVDDFGLVYVADTFNDVIRVIAPDGQVHTLAGTADVPGTADGVGASARFDHPIGISVGQHGELFVTDGYNNTIRRIAPDGRVTTIAGVAGATGSTDGPASQATFSYPMAVVEGEDGALYVADAYNNVIRKIDHGVVSTLAGTAGTQGFNDGTGASARFVYPSAITADRAGNLYVCDMDNQLIRQITPTGVVTTYVGQPEDAGIQLGNLPGGLSYPAGVAARGSELIIATGNAILSTRVDGAP
jgi:sugar lactone lactonase YvrE